MLLRAFCRPAFQKAYPGKQSGWTSTKKLLLVMKFTAIILLTACLTASAHSYSQITLSEKNVPLQKVFKEIQKQTGFNFFYTYEVVQKAGPVTVQVNNVSLQQALEESLKGKALSYEIVNNTVVIKTRPTAPATGEQEKS